MTTRSFSLGRAGETQWESLRAAYVLSRHSGVIALVASDSRDVRDEVRRRLASMAPRVQVIEPSKGVTLAIHACAKVSAEGEKIPVAWIEAPKGAPSPAEDMQWIEALVVLNQTRDALQMHGPCHVVLAGPSELHRVVATRAPDLASFMGHVLLLGDELEELMTQQEALTWMHLSDLHVAGEDWQRDTVLGGLVRDLPGLLAERDLRPELLFVTGDVAARGQRDEYDGAFRVLEEITKPLGLDRRQHVFMVPGNHDVERGRIGKLAKRDHASLLALGSDELRDAVGELLGDANEFAVYGERLGEWCAFTNRFLGRARSVSTDRPWRSDIVEVGGLLVGVLSLCTAWASGPDDRKGSLILGERQIHDMLAEARDGGARLTIALMHHPLHWLHDGEYSAVRGRLEREVDVVLHGHVHDAHSMTQVGGGGSVHVVLGAGAAYAKLGQDPYHGFSVSRLDLAKGRLDVHHFTWSTRSGKWHADTGAPGANGGGCVSLPFSPPGFASDEPRATGHEVLATRLRHAAAKVYASFDFAGLGAGGPRRHVTLEQIFVPLRFQSDALGGIDLGEEGDPEYDEDLFPGRGEKGLDWLTEVLLENGTHCIVLGGPGSGKSTLCKHVAVLAASLDGGPVPLLLTVRDWIAEGRREGLLEMAAREATQRLAIHTDAAALEQLCERQKVWLIIDGIDEAADPAVRRDLRDRVQGLVTSLPNIVVLATSRVAGYREIPLDDQFQELDILPFDDDALEEFVRRWYDLVEDDPVERVRKRVDLLHAFEVEPRAKELARNPLLATLIGMVHFSHAQLPGDRAKLYGMLIELLLVTWPAERGRELAELHGTVQQPMLEKLALRLQEQRAAEQKTKPVGHTAEVLIDIATLEEMLDEQLAERSPERSAPERRYLARKWGKWLIDECGVLQEQQPGRVGFLHLSLMEYLAGRALLEQSLGGGYGAVAGLVAERHDQAVWRETLLLMLGSESKKRELGQAVVERLLEAEPGVPAKWSACVFGLALLREEVDIGALREQLLETTRTSALTVWPTEWSLASSALADAISLSSIHRNGTQSWLNAQLESAVGEQLVGVLALASGALDEEQIEAGLAARADRQSTARALLDLGWTHPSGQWARQHATRDTELSWACSTPLDGVVTRSFEGLRHGLGSIWIPSLIGRATRIAQVASDASIQLLDERSVEGPRGLPAAVSWLIAGHPSGAASLPSALSGSSKAQDVVAPPPCMRKQFRYLSIISSQRLSQYVSQQFSQQFSRGFALDFSDSFALYFSQNRSGSAPLHFSDSFASYFSLDLAQYSTHDFLEYFSDDFLRHFTPNTFRYFSQYFSVRFSLDFSRYLSPDIPTEALPHGAADRPSYATEISWIHFRAATSDNEAQHAVTHFISAMVAEAHAALITGHSLRQPELTNALATLRVENRWLNLFFTPLVDYATATHPLPTNPDLHALLLTYGLVQYQTTWEWPDCPHWRSWFAALPPEHWLPAHVYHLVRSIQDPTNPSHRAEAEAALDRNDWPELAQALRDNTLVSTPPEVLALFDHGEAPP